MNIIDNEDRLVEILSDLTYPAEKWRVTACADIYGVDLRTRRALYGLPARTYRDAGDVTTALARAADGGLAARQAAGVSEG